MRTISICFIFLFTLSNIYSQSVNIDELKTNNKIEFINYEQKITDVHNIHDVRGIGKFLSGELNTGKEIAWYETKYWAIHAFDSEDLEKNGADIISLEKNVIILHINWIRHIITGFLQSQYNFSEKDARLLAIFITYYNAVHKGNIPYFTDNYQPIVLENISESNAGLSTYYKDWAGNSRVIIPLTDNASKQDIRSLDTSLLTDEGVIEELRKEEDMGIEERNEMVDLKEEEIDKSKEELEKDKTELEKDKEELTNTQEELEKDKEELTQKENELTTLKEELEKTTDPEERKEKEEEIAKLEEEIAKDKDEQTEKEKEIDNQTEEIKEKEENITKEEEQIKDKEQEVEKDKENIERDEKIIEVKEDPEKFVEEMEEKENIIAKTEPVIKNKMYYLDVKEYLTDGHYDNDLFIIDTLTGDIIGKLTKSQICGNEYWATEDGILVISHTNKHTGHNLTLLDIDSMEPVKTSEAFIFHRSFIQIRKDDIYAITWDGDRSYKLGKFNSDLELIAESEQVIDYNTAFHLYGDFVYINTPDKKIIVLNIKDLSENSTLDLSDY